MSLFGRARVTRSRALPLGMLGGLGGGVLFGLLLAVLGTLASVGRLVGGESVGAGLVVLVVVGLVLGGLYGLVLGPVVTTAGVAVLAGLLYGLFWWAVGTLVLMPLWLGQPVGWPAGAELVAVWNLVGYLLLGLVIALVTLLAARR